jgi:hypothetical protein
MIESFNEIVYDSLWEFFEECEENRKDIQKIYKISDKDMERIIEEDDSDLLIELTDSDTEVIEKVFEIRQGRYIVEFVDDDNCGLIRVMELGKKKPETRKMNSYYDSHNSRDKAFEEHATRGEINGK